MSTPTRIRATLKDGGTELRMLFSHPMENGLRKDAEGKRIPAHFITEVSVRRNGEVVLDAGEDGAVAVAGMVDVSGGRAGEGWLLRR